MLISCYIINSPKKGGLLEKDHVFYYSIVGKTKWKGPSKDGGYINSAISIEKGQLIKYIIIQIKIQGNRRNIELLKLSKHWIIKIKYLIK